MDHREFTGAQVMKFLQRLQDSQEENEELREQVRQLMYTEHGTEEHVTRHTSHVTRHTSHVTRHR